LTKPKLEDLLHSTKEQLTDAEQHSSHAISNLNSIATERLASDDKVLEALAALASQTLRPKEAGVDSNTIESWCQTLASLREQEAKARVDTVFNNQLVRDAQNEQSSATKDDMDELEGELQTLREEIGSMVQIVIGSQIRDPLLRNLQSVESHARQSRMGWSEYVSFPNVPYFHFAYILTIKKVTSTLEHLIAQLETISDQTVDLRSYTSVIQEFRPLIAAAEHEAVAPEDAPPEAVFSPTSSSSSRTKFLESRSATVSAIPQVLRRLDPEAVRTGDRLKILESLETATTEGTAKLRTQYAVAEDATLDNLEKSLGEKQRDLQAITQNIYANSEQNDVRLSNKDLDASLEHLHKDVDEIASALERASMNQKEQLAARSSALKAKWS
jgi:hypothetical protein